MGKIFWKVDESPNALGLLADGDTLHQNGCGIFWVPKAKVESARERDENSRICRVKTSQGVLERAGIPMDIEINQEFLDKVAAKKKAA